MNGSRFVELLDTHHTSYSRADVSLEDVLAETRRMSQSSTISERTASDKSLSPTSSSYSRPVEPIKIRVRRFSIMKKK